MNARIRPGALVLVRWAGLPKTPPFQLHLVRELPLLQNVGTVDRIDDRRGEHCVVVIFWSIPCLPFGALWVDTFTLGELVIVEP